MRGPNDSRGSSFPSWSSTHDKEFYTYLSCVEIVMSLDSPRQRLSRNFFLSITRIRSGQTEKKGER